MAPPIVTLLIDVNNYFSDVLDVYASSSEFAIAAVNATITATTASATGSSTGAR